MPINQRLTSPKARFKDDPQMVRTWLADYSKSNPALVSQQIYDAIKDNPDLQDCLPKVKIQ